MMQLRLILFLDFKTAAKFSRIVFAFEHFNRRLQLKLFVFALRQINRAHSAKTEFADNFVNPDFPPDQRIFRPSIVIKKILRQIVRRNRHKFFGFFFDSEQ